MNRENARLRSWSPGHTIKRICATTALVILYVSAAGCTKSEKPLPAERPKIRIQEGYSETFIKALQQQEEAITSASPELNLAQVQSIRSILRTWPNKKVIKVAFKGGSAELRKQISLVAAKRCPLGRGPEGRSEGISPRSSVGRTSAQ